MEKLTMPLGGRIDVLIHISDVHIKIGDLEKSRYEDYEETFNNFEQLLIKIPQVSQKTAVTVFCGDFFHYKNKLDSLSVRLFYLLIEKITNHTPLYLIQGNHDFQQSEAKIPNTISSLLYNNQNPMINFLDNTGYYLAGNVGIGFVSIKDVLQVGNGCGYVEKLPSFPNASLFPSSVTTKVALFHGSFNKATFYNGMNASDGLPIDWIKSCGYHIGLFGDIHKCQIHPCETNTWDQDFTWGYPGSLLQLDFGEDPKDHGFLLWNLVDKKVVHYDVPSPTKFINVVCEEDQLYYYIDRKQKLLYDQMNFNEIKHLNIKFKGDVLESYTNSLQESLKARNISSNITKGFLTFKFNGSDSILKQQGTQIDISQYNSQNMWIDYIQKSDKDNVLNDHIWKEWILNPTTLLLSNLHLTDSDLQKTAIKRDSEIQSAIDKFNISLSQIKSTKKQLFCLHYMEWQWIICYGCGNYYNFDNNKNKICIINGVNSSGKTSFLETIAYGLYGEELPSRHDKSNTSAIISDKKPNGQTAQIMVIFSVGDKYYKIARTIVPNPTNKNSAKCKKISLEEISGQNGHSISCMSTSVTFIYQWVISNIGTFDNFIMSCMITQNSDCDFFNYKDAEQIKLLDETLHLNCIDDMSNVINKVQLGLEDLQNCCSTLKSHIDTSCHKQPIDLNEIEKIKLEIDMKNKHLEQLKKEFEVIHESWYQLSTDDLTLDDQTISNNIINYQQLLSKFTDIDKDVSILLQEKAVVDEKVKMINSYKTNVKFNLKMIHQLSFYESQNIIKPSCDRVYYQHELEKIIKWRSDHQRILKLSQMELKEKVEEVNAKIKSQHELSSLFTQRKPNNPKISMNEYLQFMRELSIINDKINKLEQMYNTPMKLKEYCLKNPLPIMDNGYTLDELKNQYEKIIGHFMDSSWSNKLVSQLKEIVIEKQNLLGQKTQQIDQVCTKQEKTIQEIEQINDDLMECDIIIDSIGHLSKPRISFDDVRQWLDRYELMNQQFEQKKNLLCTQENKLSEYLVRQKSYNEWQEESDKLQKEMKDIESQKLPFNPKCEACCRQPWKIRQTQINEKLHKLTMSLKMSSDLNECIRETQTQISQLQQWVNEYQRLQISLQDYQKWKEDWIYYNQNIEFFESTRKDRVDKQKMLAQLRKLDKQLRHDKQTLENDKQDIQRIINGLYDAINNKPLLDKLQKQIDDLNKWNKESKIHQIFQQYQTFNIEYYNEQKKLIDENLQWKTDYDNNEHEIKNNECLIKELNNNLLIFVENERYSSNEVEYLDKIKQWDIFDKHQRTIMELRHCIFSHQSYEIMLKIENIKKKTEITNKYQYWKDVKTNKPLYYKKKKLNEEINQLLEVIQNLNVDYGHQKNICDTYFKNIKDIETYESLSVQLNKKIVAIKTINNMLSGYRIWLYENIVVPETVKMVNAIMSNVTQRDDYCLEGSIIKNKTININWSVNSPTGKSTIEKSGGFQKHIIGLIMRITLSKQGCSNINNTQIFLDESFVSCDASNLEKMPYFLNNLLDIFPNGIILVSHLPTIKDCGHHSVSIKKNNDQTSIIQFGIKHWLESQNGATSHKNSTIVDNQSITPNKITTIVDNQLITPNNCESTQNIPVKCKKIQVKLKNIN